MKSKLELEEDLLPSDDSLLPDPDPIPNIAHARSSTETRAYLASLDKCYASQANAAIESGTLRSQTSRKLARLDLLRSRVGSSVVSTRSMRHKAVTNASATASKISSAVRCLDTEQSGVSATLSVVDQVSELKACVLGVTGSMGAPQDWETAAVYLNRAFKIPRTIVEGEFAEKIVPTAEVPEPPRVTLAHAAEHLRDIFLEEFERAAVEGNGGKVTRFFKLFPLIGKPEVGLDIYGKYICQGVASRARGNLRDLPLKGDQNDWSFFAGVLTKLFEHVAQIVESHGGLVERHYGSGSMVNVIQRLQAEVDIQGGMVIDTWSDERSVEKHLTDIRSYAFTFLVQSFLPPTASKSGISRVGSPAVRSSIVNQRSTEDETVSMKECDSIMSEVALMLSGWTLFCRFITTKTKSPDDSSKQQRLPSLLTKSSLYQKVCDKLIIAFNTMTTFYFRRSVEKAFQLDEPPSNLFLSLEDSLATNPPYITSVVDDVMYILNQVLDKVFSSSQKVVFASVIPTISRILSSDFIGMIQRKMRDEFYPKAAVQGALPPEDTTISFLVLINNLDVAIEYTQRIVRAHVGPGSETPELEVLATSKVLDRFPFEEDAFTVCNVIRALETGFTGKANELIGDGIFVAFRNVIKPRLRPLLADAFRDVDYQMSTPNLDNTHISVEPNGRRSADDVGAVQDIFQKGWDLLTKPITRILTPRSAEKLLAIVVSHLSELLEKRIWSYYGRIGALGGVRLERDIADILSIVARDGKYRLRDAFARCTQICMLMNMEEDEWDELRDGATTKDGDIQWQLNEEERLRARSMI